MNSFLELVAKDLLEKHGTDLSQTVVVFPNKRAALFLNEALATTTQKPIWSPTYTTISDLFRQHSHHQVADPVKLVCVLHRVFTEVTGIDETLDHFFGWGQLLLADFDDIDKNLAPAQQVFANLRDIHELDDISYLTPEQRDVIRKFFSNFTDNHNSLLKERFLRLWSNMGEIYRGLNELLDSQQLTYEGALYRSVAEDESIDFSAGQYVFVGFNLLHKSEQRLFTRLRRMGKARFYWDFDHAYLESEAGQYLRQHLTRFPNELDNDTAEAYRCFNQHKNIRFMAASTENIQARYVSQWLNESPSRIANGRRTAIVLCNEALLTTVIHTLPDTVKHANVTTGYPLQLTPAATLIQQLIALRTMGYDRQRNRFRQRYVNALLRHPYVSLLSPEDTDMVFSLPTPEQPRQNGNEALMRWIATIISHIAQSVTSQLDTESLFRAYTLINRMATLIGSGELQVDVITLSRLITQLIQQASIPFHGEPAIGLQIMGLLETRNLDFDHLLLLSTNEGNIPRGVSDSSFIPYSIRKAFGMTTVDNKVAIYAYYFHRLLARATDITLVYNNATADGHTGEMSRFMLQLLVEGQHAIGQFTLQAADHGNSQTELRQQHHAIQKTASIVEALRNRFDINSQPPTYDGWPILTPTAINRYMRCQLQFYYNYVEGLREPDETDEDVIDNRIFGNIFHEAAHTLYQRLTQTSPLIRASYLEQVLRQKADIERCVDNAISKELFRLNGQQNKHPELNGLQTINRQVIIHYLRTLLKIDSKLAPLTIKGLETDVTARLTIASLGITTTIGGRIDRLDAVTYQQAPITRVIDYKTGSRRLKPLKNIEAIFDPSQLHNHNDYYLQALLYARLVQQQYDSRQQPVAPALLFIQHAGAEQYNPILQIGSELITSMNTPDGERFEQLLKEKIEEIFNPDISFQPTLDSDVCRTCHYQHFCGL